MTEPERSTEPAKWICPCCGGDRVVPGLVRSEPSFDEVCPACRGAGAVLPEVGQAWLDRMDEMLEEFRSEHGWND